MSAERIAEIDAEVKSLLEKIDAIHSDPRSKIAVDSPWIYNPKARRKTDALRRKIADLTAEKRTLNGETLNTAGYTGRNSNR